MKTVLLTPRHLFTQSVHDGLDNGKLDQRSIPIYLNNNFLIMANIPVSMNGIIKRLQEKLIDK